MYLCQGLQRRYLNNSRDSVTVRAYPRCPPETPFWFSRLFCSLNLISISTAYFSVYPDHSFRNKMRALIMQWLDSQFNQDGWTSDHSQEIWNLVWEILQRVWAIEWGSAKECPFLVQKCYILVRPVRWSERGWPSTCVHYPEQWFRV